MPQVLPAEIQNRALNALLDSLKPETLALPDSIVKLIPPRAFGFPRWRETFRIRTGLTFDSLAPPESAANIILYLVLQPERAARLVEFHSRDNKLPGLSETIDRLLLATWKAPIETGYRGEIRRTTDMLALYYLMNLTANEQAASQVRAIGYEKLDELRTWLKTQMGKNSDQKAHFVYAISEIDRFQKDPKQIHLTPPLEVPPGAPIGD